MSIRDAIAEAVQKGDLYHLPTFAISPAPTRAVFVTSEVMDFVVRALPRELAYASSNARLMLDSFSVGDRFAVSIDPHNKRHVCQLSRNSPKSEGVWQFRIRDPKPQLRIFGCFAEKDTFVALSVALREDLTGNFGLAVVENSAIWGDIFRYHQPLTGDELDAYLSNYFVAS
jgi:hypothetical protein